MAALKKDKDDVVSLLKEMAVLLELDDANVFKIRAFQNAARTMETTSESLQTLIETSTLTDLQGIGKGIAADIEDFATTGTLEAHTDLSKKFPETLFELFEIPGLGPKKIKVLFKELGIESMTQLEYACQENRLLKLKGFGEKTQEQIMKGISFLKQSAGRHRYVDVIDEVADLLSKVQKIKDVKEAAIAGSLRRKKEIVKDADILCATTKPKHVTDAFLKIKSIDDVLVTGRTKTSVRLKSGIQIDLRVVKPGEFASALHHFTGSKEHNTQIRARAKKRGLKVSEWGVFDGDKKLKVASEKELFATLDLQFIEPELREGMDEIKQAEKDQLPTLIQEEDIQGVFHMHTTYSDGKHSLEEMIQTSIDLGYAYMGVTDHSKSAFYAHGLLDKDIAKQHKEIDKLQKKYPQIRIFKGIESDILKDGSLDYPDRILKTFDFVIASVHSNFRMSKKQMTERCKKALDHKRTTMLGHPTGRILLGREPFEIDMNAIIDHAADAQKIVELNASPYRLDVDWRLLPYVKKKNAQVSINPDAHSIEGLHDVTFGVNMARKGGLEKTHVFNTQPLDEIEAFFENQ